MVGREAPATRARECSCSWLRDTECPVHGATTTESEYRDAMGCEWMTVVEARQAIPPAYTELIGHQLMAHIRMEAA